ncbi:hypothetical protein ATHL_03186 [Anaerolinea thermolimosa]|uniref:Nucleotidyltransferase domain-containing protein n=1 Tax=Anaerolinea thermolimosa TaxID=229919 RepID=A0A7U9PX12_9CHLR|nr:hypothetical protein [Anaerolinea thermolimosa]GAP08284.1 hypothetical protein ATHL_03186 [Anaerolinea thermolimosa]
MRITRDTLLRIARETAEQRAKISRRLICIYLVGSCLSEDPLLGGTTDIDLVIIHDSEPLEPREMVRLSDEIHLDISHYSEALFRQPRQLRTHPWLGPFIYNKPLVLYDSRHWFDYIQAATGAQFLQPEYVLARARALASLARQEWSNLAFAPSSDHRRRVVGFLKALENAGNAFAVLTGPPLTERRFLLELPRRAAALGRPQLSASLSALLAGEVEVSDDVWQSWMRHWDEAFQQVSSQETFPTRLHSCRSAYYSRAASALWEGNPGAAFWVLMRIWTLSVAHVPADSPVILPWQETCQMVGLDRNHFASRLEALDAYLDQVEEILDAWGENHGVIPFQE